MQVSEFEALSFDCYGTLIDWETGIWDAYQPLLRDNHAGVVDRHELLALHARLESDRQRQEPSDPYPRILEWVHAAAARHLGFDSTSGLDAGFGVSVGSWPAFADTANALRRLSTRYRLVILSNVDRAGFARSAEKLGVGFDAVFTAEDIGSYKPELRNFELMLAGVRSELGLEPTSVLHVAQSLFHDHVPARAMGLANVWIDRQGLADGGAWGATAVVEDRPTFDARFTSLEAFADAAGV